MKPEGPLKRVYKVRFPIKNNIFYMGHILGVYGLYIFHRKNLGTSSYFSITLTTFLDLALPC